MTRQGYFAGGNRTHPPSIKQTIQRIKEAMALEPEGSPGREQYQRALEYWEGRLKSHA